MSLLGGYLVACGLLIVAGSAKAFRPQNTATALAGVLPVHSVSTVRRALRVFAIAEAALGASAALAPYPILAGAVGASYVAFAAFVLYVRRRGGVLATCGCFSTPDTPPTKLHVAINLSLAACAGAVTASESQPLLPSLLQKQPLDGVPLLGAGAVCVWLVIMALVGLPRLAEARRPFEEGTTAG